MHISGFSLQLFSLSLYFCYFPLQLFATRQQVRSPHPGCFSFIQSCSISTSTKSCTLAISVFVSHQESYITYIFLLAASKEARSPRPPFVFLRVGDVVMERRGHMVGVVVSWDPELRAPPEWIDRVYSDDVSTFTHYSRSKKPVFSLTIDRAPQVGIKGFI